MNIVNDILDEYHAIYTATLPWRKYWRAIASYVLPQTEGFDTLVSTDPAGAISTVATMPVASEKSKHIYDMTSIWAIERLSSGLLSLKTPETSTWHDVSGTDDFGREMSDEEKAALEKVRDYLFRMRSNPHSGFWPAHRAAMRSMCAFGDGWLFIPDSDGRSPYRYEYVPLSEVFAGVDEAGRPNRMYRPVRWTAEQIVRKWGDAAGKKANDMANDPKRKFDLMTVLQGIRPRDEGDRRGKLGARSGAFASYYMLPEEKHLIGEGGYYEFPYVRYAWSHIGAKAQCEGPIAYALGEVKSLQEMARNELIASQQMIRPALGTRDKNMGRINFNPGAVNPGMISGDGRQLFAPLTTGARPDFAQSVLEARRTAVRETLYLSLWQVLIEQPEKTATEAMIRAQEKGELLGPVGISMNSGLAMLFDREIAILDRKGAFNDGSPLALPESLMGREISPEWTSPLDRLRRMGDLVGMQRLATFAGELAAGLQRPEIAKRVNADEMLDHARDILGAPVDTLHSKEEIAEQGAQGGQMEQLLGMLGAGKGAGDAMKSIGDGAASLTQAAELAKAAGGAPAAAPAQTI